MSDEDQIVLKTIAALNGECCKTCRQGAHSTKSPSIFCTHGQREEQYVDDNHWCERWEKRK